MSQTNISIVDIAEPIIESKAFRRLYDISFLGILSPRFSRLPGHPLSSPKAKNARQASDDESRACHSLEVANIVLSFCEWFSPKEHTKRYAVAWALLHDIATWPLSHTSEVAFTYITGLTHNALRQKMVIGHPSIPRDFRIDDVIQEMGVCPNTVMELFNKGSKPSDTRLWLLYSFVHSVITPDTLEGICRSRRALGLPASSPSDVLASFEMDLSHAVIARKDSRPVLKFMREKKEIYQNYLNTRRAIEYESRWSDSIKDLFGSVTLTESLELPEDRMVATVSRKGLPAFNAIGRYKAPRRYLISETLKNKRTLQKDRNLEDLGQIFHSELR